MFFSNCFGLEIVSFQFCVFDVMLTWVMEVFFHHCTAPTTGAPNQIEMKKYWNLNLSRSLSLPHSLPPSPSLYPSLPISVSPSVPLSLGLSLPLPLSSLFSSSLSLFASLSTTPPLGPNPDEIKKALELNSFPQFSLPHQIQKILQTQDESEAANQSSRFPSVRNWDAPREKKAKIIKSKKTRGWQQIEMLARQFVSSNWSTFCNAQEMIMPRRMESLPLWKYSGSANV